MRTPKGVGASSIAETMTAGAAIMPLSAAPLTPSGVSGVGLHVDHLDWRRDGPAEWSLQFERLGLSLPE
jgi:hypothetical protein